jgi:hypothetical protein
VALTSDGDVGWITRLTACRYDGNENKIRKAVTRDSAIVLDLSAHLRRSISRFAERVEPEGNCRIYISSSRDRFSPKRLEYA